MSAHRVAFFKGIVMVQKNLFIYRNPDEGLQYALHSQTERASIICLPKEAFYIDCCINPFVDTSITTSTLN